jgi:hypothetical protein
MPSFLIRDWRVVRFDVALAGSHTRVANKPCGCIARELLLNRRRVLEVKRVVWGLGDPHSWG